MSDKIVLWEKSIEHDRITEQFVAKKTIYNEKQNYPELIVEDVLNLFEPELQFRQLFDWSEASGWQPSKTLEDRKQWYRNQLYAILLKRGVNKWLFVCKLLIRLKKKYQYRIREIQETLKLYGNQLTPQEYWKLKGQLKVYGEVRRELKLLSVTPRWVIWNWKNVGLIDNSGMQKSIWQKWKHFYDELINRRFEK